MDVKAIGFILILAGVVLQAYEQYEYAEVFWYYIKDKAAVAPLALYIVAGFQTLIWVYSIYYLFKGYLGLKFLMYPIFFISFILSFVASILIGLQFLSQPDEQTFTELIVGMFFFGSDLCMSGGILYLFLNYKPEPTYYILPYNGAYTLIKY